MKTPHELWVLAKGDDARYKELLICHGLLIPKEPFLPPWFPKLALGFDTETTAPDPTEARLVTATTVEVGVKGLGTTREWLVDPGVDIPAEAAAIHGVTTEMVRGLAPHSRSAIFQILETLHDAWSRGLAVIAMNANYDMTVIDREADRHRINGFVVGPILDPFVIDRGVDPFRKGKRTLSALAAHYGVRQDGAHSSTGDALCAARIVWAMGKRCGTDAKFKQVRDLTLEQMQAWQAKAHAERQANYQEYLAKQGKPQVIDGSWPLRARSP